MRIKNNSATTIPAFGVVRVTGVAVLKGHPHVTVDQPNAYGGRAGRYLVNGPYPVPAGQYGEAQDGPLYSVYFDTSDSATPAIGEEWGPVSGGWKARKNVPGFRVIGLPNAGDKIMLALMSPMTTVIGKPDAAFTQGVLSAPSNVVSVWLGPGDSSDADTTHNLTVRYATADCATTDYVACEEIGGEIYVSPLEC